MVSAIQGERGGGTKYNGVNHLTMATGDMDKTIRLWKDNYWYESMTCSTCHLSISRLEAARESPRPFNSL